jgi:hypothetical protein
MKLALIPALALSLAFASAVSSPQGPMPPPKELGAISFLKGTWDVDLKMFDQGKEMGAVKGTIVTSDALGGMYHETRYDTDMGGMPMTGIQLTTYDPAKKEYLAYWFDNMGPGGLEMRGKLKGQTLILVSKPIEIPGMPGKHAFRATSSMKGVGKVLFRLEMDSGKGWGKMLEGTMSRK